MSRFHWKARQRVLSWSRCYLAEAHLPSWDVTHLRPSWPCYAQYSNLSGTRSDQLFRSPSCCFATFRGLTCTRSQLGYTGESYHNTCPLASEAYTCLYHEDHLQLSTSARMTLWSCSAYSRSRRSSGWPAACRSRDRFQWRYRSGSNCLKACPWFV